MKSSDPSSLQNLNDIVLPVEVSWWPLATGWYFLFGLLLIVIAWTGYQLLRRWLNNRYRRAALQELRSLANDLQDEVSRDSSLKKIPVLLKRTALSAYPRNQVASLSGSDWHHFLNSKLKNPSFTEVAATTLDRISYSAGELSEVDSNAETALLNASFYWLKHHQPASGPENSRET